MLRDLGRALSEAISDSPEVGRSLHRIREEGYSLYLLVDCKRDGEDAPGSRRRSGERAKEQGIEPMFKIDGRDLLFLRSIGIDPTKRRRRRR